MQTCISKSFVGLFLQMLAKKNDKLKKILQVNVLVFLKLYLWLGSNLKVVMTWIFLFIYYINIFLGAHL